MKISGLNFFTPAQKHLTPTAQPAKFKVEPMNGLGWEVMNQSERLLGNINTGTLNYLVEPFHDWSPRGIWKEPYGILGGRLQFLPGESVSIRGFFKGKKPYALRIMSVRRGKKEPTVQLTFPCGKRPAVELISPDESQATLLHCSKMSPAQAADRCTTRNHNNRTIFLSCAPEDMSKLITEGQRVALLIQQHIIHGLGVAKNILPLKMNA